MKIEHKIFESEVKAFDDENLTVEHFISTEHKDRGGDIMRAKGMKVVGKPVVLLLHGRGPMGSEPVAKPLSITIDEFKGQPGILAKTQFYNDEVGQRLYGKVKGGFLPNWSIGYAVDEAKDLLRDGRYDGRDVTKWQLLEYSPVGVPMNPFAQTIKEFLDLSDADDPRLQHIAKTVDDGPGWFGIVEEGVCRTCKGPITHFAEGEKVLGSACEKCQPEEFARLQKEIKPPVDPLVAINALLEELRGKFADNDVALQACIASAKNFDAMVMKLEPLLATLPPEPEGGDKGKGSDGNPPDGETPPALVFKDTEREAREKKARDDAAAIAAVQDALRPILTGQVDRLLGKVN